MLRIHILLGLLLIGCQFPALAQSETVRELPPKAIALYPTLEDMHGYAVGKYKDYLLIFGGSIRSKVGEQAYDNFPNLDILLIDFRENRASAFTNGSYEGSLGEQISATGLSYHQEGNTLYLLGGYGYSEMQNQYITFPYITVIDLQATVLALLNGTDPQASFFQLCDERMAIFNGTMDYNGDEFFLINGKFAYKVHPFAKNAEYVEEAYDREVRTFKLAKDGREWYLEEFQTWYDLEAFEDIYGSLMPDRIEEALRAMKRKQGFEQ